MKFNFLKKSFIVFGFLMLLSSCGSSLENDAKKLAELSCKVEKDMTDMESIQELSELTEKFEKKYSEKEEKEKFGIAFLNAKNKCN